MQQGKRHHILVFGTQITGGQCFGYHAEDQATQHGARDGCRYRRDTAAVKALRPAMKPMVRIDDAVIHPQQHPGNGGQCRTDAQRSGR